VKKITQLSGALHWWATVAALLVLSCFNDDLPPPRALQPPLQDLRFHSKREVFVHSAPHVGLADLCDLSMFGGLWPGMTAQEARAILGSPERVYQEHKGLNTVFAFPRERGIIEVLKQRVESEGFEGFNWYLRWRPQGRSHKVGLDSAILELIPELPGHVTINILSSDGVMTVEVEDGDVTSVLWLQRGPSTAPKAGEVMQPLVLEAP
jgi:hypothetical protein